MTPLESFELILGLLAIALVLPIIGRRLPLPPAATLVVGGMVLAAVPGSTSVELDPDLIMVLFLPPLLMASAYIVAIFESLVFVLIGLSLRGVLDRFGGLQPALEAAGPVTLAVIATVALSRLLWVFPGVYLPRWLSPALRRRDPAPPASSILVMDGPACAAW